MAPRLALIIFALISVYAKAGMFAGEEYAGRLRRAQAKMKEEGIGALFLTLEVHHIYFTGVDTEFWESPTRPYYLVVPADGKTIAVVPTVSNTLYEALDHTVGEVHTWPSPRPDDDGISLLVEVFKKLPSQPGKKLVIGAELGPELYLRMPPVDFARIQELVGADGHAETTDATRLLLKLRATKSDVEVAQQRLACQRQSKALANIPNILKAGMTEKQASRLARIELIKAGADRVDYVACRSAQGGYYDIVGAAGDRKLQEGDVLIIDTGSVHDNYFCDFNRNWYVGTEIPPELAAVQERLYRAVDAGIAAAVPGHTTADMFHAMADVLGGNVGNVGRMGHGVGLAITEWPSIMAREANRSVTLEDGMIFAIEPGLGFGDRGQFLVHEENVVVRKGGAQLHSVRAPRTMPMIKGKLADGERTELSSNDVAAKHSIQMNVGPKGDTAESDWDHIMEA